MTATLKAVSTALAEEWRLFAEDEEVVYLVGRYEESFKAIIQNTALNTPNWQTNTLTWNRSVLPALTDLPARKEFKWWHHAVAMEAFAEGTPYPLPLILTTSLVLRVKYHLFHVKYQWDRDCIDLRVAETAAV